MFALFAGVNICIVEWTNEAVHCGCECLSSLLVDLPALHACFALSWISGKPPLTYLEPVQVGEREDSQRQDGWPTAPPYLVEAYAVQ